MLPYAVAPLFLVVPFSVGGLAWPLAVLVVAFWVQRATTAALDEQQTEVRYPATSVIAVFAVVVAVLTLARQFDQPVELHEITVLPNAEGQFAGSAFETVSGTQIGDDGTSVHVGTEGTIRSVSRAHVVRINLGAIGDEPRPDSILGVEGCTPLSCRALADLGL